MDTGRAIKALRTYKGISQGDLAARVGISRTALGSIERGEATPRTETLAKIASELGTTSSDLIDFDLAIRSK